MSQIFSPPQILFFRFFFFHFPHYQHMDTSKADQIADLVLNAFDKLPKKGKPLLQNNGDIQWTVLSGIVVEFENEELECVCLATGMKSLPNTKLSQCLGKVLHDSHAEILTIRAFNKFLLENYNNDRYFTASKKTFKPKVHLYVSEAPCGDASLGLLNHDQSYMWTDDLVRVTPSDDSPVSGRDHFHHVGLVRTKPARRTAPMTFSKSCSDKLALRQVTSLLLGPLEKLGTIEPIFLDTLIIPKSRFVEKDYKRAFRERLHSPTHYFKFATTNKEFMYQRRQEKCASCPQTVIWIKGYTTEVILNGVKMGSKPFSGKGQSMICRASIWNSVLKLQHEAMKNDDDEGVSKRRKYDSYVEWKQCKRRISLKNLAYKELGSWVPTAIDDFSI